MEIIGTPDSRLINEDPYGNIAVSLLMSMDRTRFKSVPRVINSFISTCYNVEKRKPQGLPCG